MLKYSWHRFKCNSYTQALRVVILQCDSLASVVSRSARRWTSALECVKRELCWNTPLWLWQLSEFKVFHWNRFKSLQKTNIFVEDARNFFNVGMMSILFKKIWWQLHGDLMGCKSNRFTFFIGRRMLCIQFTFTILIQTQFTDRSNNCAWYSIQINQNK